MTHWREQVTTITWEVPYRVLDGDGPLVVGLHGRGEDAPRMSRRLLPLETIPARLLVPRGPHPVEIRRGERRRIGYGWYHYDGNADRFVASMERAAQLLFPLIDDVGGSRAPGRTFLVGFSQGAYLAYYLALRHPDRFLGVVGAGGRAKAEVLLPHVDAARGVRVLHLHGAGDPLVDGEACRASIDRLGAAGLDATFRELPGGHELTPAMVDEIAGWITETLAGEEVPS